jgi:methyl-accepting chemotaxis protein
VTAAPAELVGFDESDAQTLSALSLDGRADVESAVRELAPSTDDEATAADGGEVLESETDGPTGDGPTDDQLDVLVEQIDEHVGETFEQATSLSRLAALDAGVGLEAYEFGDADLQAEYDELADEKADLEQRLDRAGAVGEGAQATVTDLDQSADVVDAATGMGGITDATDQQTASTEEIASMIDDDATKADRVSDEVDSIAAATEEQVMMIAELDETVSKL